MLTHGVDLPFQRPGPVAHPDPTNPLELSNNLSPSATDLAYHAFKRTVRDMLLQGGPIAFQRPSQSPNGGYVVFKRTPCSQAWPSGSPGSCFNNLARKNRLAREMTQAFQRSACVCFALWRFNFLWGSLKPRWLSSSNIPSHTASSSTYHLQDSNNPALEWSAACPYPGRHGRPDFNDPRRRSPAFQMVCER